MKCSRLHFSTVLLLLMLWLPCSVNGAAVVRSVRIQGNTVFSAREILDRLATRPQFVYSHAVATSDINNLKENYKANGYLSASVTSNVTFVTSDSTLADVTLEIIEGKKTIVGDIAIERITQFNRSDVLASFDLASGSPLQEQVLERDIDALLGRYEQIGYPFAEAEVRSMHLAEGPEEDTLHITIHVNEGSPLAINEIKVEGVKETDPAVVIRETRIGTGELFNPRKVDAIRSRLLRLNIFAGVEEPQLYTRNTSGGLLIRVQEGNTNTFDGVIGYIPGSGTNQSGYVTGLVSVAMRNLFGTGRRLAFRWAREDRSSQELSFRYLEPWIFGLPANIGGGFLQRQQDSSYVRRVLDGRAELMLSEEFSVAALINSESVIPSVSDTLFSRVFESSIISVGGELLYDTRDDAISPTAGARYRTDYQYGRKRVSRIPAGFAERIPAKSSVQRFTLDLDFYLSPFQRQVLAFGIHGRELQSGNPEEGEMFRLGGSRTLRGFRENQFIGSRVGWANAEYRFLLARRSFFYGFLDAGYYSRPADGVRNLPGAEAFKYGYGIGVQLETGLGVLGVSFAIGSDNPSFSAGKIHFGLINEF